MDVAKNTKRTQTRLNAATSAALDDADTLVAARLQTLWQVQQARGAQLLRTVNNLTALHGASSAVVVTAQAGVASTQAAASRIELVRRQTVAIAPTVTATSWAVWGHVFDAAAKPLAGYTIFLMDNEKRYQSNCGFSYTDASGAFALSGVGESGKAAALPKVYLSVANVKSEQVYLGDQPQKLALGLALYIPVQLPVGTPALGDLPAEIRRVALPPDKQVGRS
jgi:hypothetical protein